MILVLKIDCMCDNYINLRKKINFKVINYLITLIKNFINNMIL